MGAATGLLSGAGRPGPASAAAVAGAGGLGGLAALAAPLTGAAGYAAPCCSCHTWCCRLCSCCCCHCCACCSCSCSCRSGLLGECRLGRGAAGVAAAGLPEGANPAKLPPTAAVGEQGSRGDRPSAARSASWLSFSSTPRLAAAAAAAASSSAADMALL